MVQTTLRSSALVFSVVALGGCCGSAGMTARASYGASYGTTPPPSGQTVVVQEQQPPPPPPPPAPPPETHSHTTVVATRPQTPARPRPQPTRPQTPHDSHGRVSTGVRVNVQPGRRPPAPPQDTPFGSTTPTSNSLTGNLYFLPDNTQRLPNLLQLTPVGQVYTQRIDIPARSFDDGFPGVSDRFEWFAIRYTGTVAFPTAGTYAFRILSDDGARLYIDGHLVVDNDGQHAPAERRGTIQLTPGNHEFVLEYFQGPRYQIALQLYMTPPGGQENIFSLE
jgi:hypothetical protein